MPDNPTPLELPLIRVIEHAGERWISEADFHAALQMPSKLVEEAAESMVYAVCTAGDSAIDGLRKAIACFYTVGARIIK